MQLNILQLHRTIQEKKQKKNESFQRVLTICHRRIQVAADGQQMNVFIVVPEFVVGCPMFNMNECLEYVIDALRKNGFLVKYYFPKILYISWDYEEINADKRPPAPISTSKEGNRLGFGGQKPKALLTSNITTNKKGRLAMIL
jgi:hypothetical protein